MEYLKIFTDQDIFANPEFERPSTFEKRITVKAVVKNDQGKFAFVTNPIHGFYLLPGGGAESDNLEVEIKRECEEEVNYIVDVVRKIGVVQEYRNREGKEYITACFVVYTVKESNDDTRTQDEKDNNLQVVWFTEEEASTTLQGQVEKVKKGEVNVYNTAFNIVRDYLFFSTYLEQHNR